MTVTTGADGIGRFGESITIDCYVTGPEVNSIQWMKYINNVPVRIRVDGVKYTGGSVSTKALTIHSLTNDDAHQYQCTASNQGGDYSSAHKATVQVKCEWYCIPCKLKKYRLEVYCLHQKFVTSVQEAFYLNHFCT